MEKQVYLVEITSCDVPTAWYASLVGHRFECYEWGKDYVLKQDYDAGDQYWWRHITKDNCVVVSAASRDIIHTSIDPPLADGTRTDSKNMFVAPESRTDGTDELEYKKRYKARLIERWGMDEDFAQETADVAEFDPQDNQPEDHADDCASYMAQDA